MGDYERAAETLAAALPLAERSGDRRAISHSRHRRSQVSP
jgi:hypothetical protein